MDPHTNVLSPSHELPCEPVEVKGYDFNNGVDYHRLLQTYRYSGFQATNFGLAVEEIIKMVSHGVWKPQRKGLFYGIIYLVIFIDNFKKLSD